MRAVLEPKRACRQSPAWPPDGPSAVFYLCGLTAFLVRLSFPLECFTTPVDVVCSAQSLGNRTKEGFEDSADNVKQGWRNTKRSAQETMDDASESARDAWGNTKESARRTGDDIDDAARR